MAHFFVPPQNFRGQEFFFDPSESRHLSKSLRKKSGDVIRVFNGEGIVQDARILDAGDPDRVTAELIQTSDSPARSLPPQNSRKINLYPALIKGPRFDWMLEKLTELSVDEIHPVTTARTVIHIKSEEKTAKAARWEKIIMAAAKQCGRKNFAKIHEPISFENAVRALSKNQKNLILWEGEERISLAEALHEEGKSAADINLFIGPEGGFSVEESQIAVREGLIPVHLGENILRAETAAIAGAAFLLLSSWRTS